MKTITKTEYPNGFRGKSQVFELELYCIRLLLSLQSDRIVFQFERSHVWNYQVYIVSPILRTVPSKEC